MLAASYWSLLAPAIELAESSGLYGDEGQHAYAPVAVGFLLGALFVYLADEIMSRFNIGATNLMLGEIMIKPPVFIIRLTLFIVPLSFKRRTKSFTQTGQEKKRRRRC